MADRLKMAESGPRPPLRVILLSTVFIAGAYLLGTTCLRAQANRTFLAMPIGAAAPLALWAFCAYRRGELTWYTFWKQMSMVGVLCAMGLLYYGGCHPLLGLALMYAVMLAWWVTKRYGSQWQPIPNPDAETPAVRLLGGTDGPGADATRAVSVSNDWHDSIADAVIEYETADGLTRQSVGRRMDPRALFGPIHLPRDCSHVALTYSSAEGDRYEQHWRWDEGVGWYALGEPTTEQAADMTPDV